MFIVGRVTAPIEADTNPFQAGLNSAFSMGSSFANKIGSTIQGVGHSIVSLGQSLTKFVTLPLAGGVLAAAKFGKDFEKEMSKVVGLVGVSQKQVNAWKGDILAMSPELAKPPQELAEAMFFVTSAGLRGAEALDVLKMSGKASAAGLGDTATVADLVTSAMNAYGAENLSASKATDILVAAVREGKAEAAELAASMGQVLPLASELGVTFDQVAATQAAMTKTGTPATEAATQLKSIMAGLIKPSKQAEEQLRAMGTSSAEMRKKIKDEGLLKALMDLRQMTNKYGEEAMSRVFPNIRALMGVLDLMGSNLEGNKKTFDAVRNSTGSLDKAFQSASETVDFKWNAALSGLQANAVKAFDLLKGVLVPVLDTLNNVITKVGKKFQALSPVQKKITMGFGLIAAVLGPALTIIGTAIIALGSVIGGLITGITGLITLISTVGLPVLAALALAIPLIASVITAMLIPIAAWIASFIALFKTNKEFRAKVVKTWNVIKENAIAIFNEIKNFILYVIVKIKDFWAKHGDEIMSIVDKVWTFILDYISFAVKNVKDIIKTILSIIEGDWDSAWESIKDIANRTWEFIKSKVRDFLMYLLNKFKEKFEDIKETIRNKLNKAKDAIVEWIRSLPEKILNGLLLMKTFISQKFDEIKMKINEKLNEWETNIINWFKGLPNKIVEQLKKWKEVLVKWMISQNEENKRQFKEWGKQISDWFTNTKTKIKEKLSSWWSTMKNWFSEIPGKIKGQFVSWKQTISDWFTNMKTKIREKLDSWWSTMKNWFITIPNKKEIKDSGKNVVNKMGDGVNIKKKSFQDKLGKVIVDGAKFAVMFAGVALMSAGREIVKRISKAVSGAKSNLYQAGRNMIQSLINGLLSKLSDLMITMNTLATIARSYWPFSPAKRGPLKDLNKMNFSGSIIESLDKAMNDIDSHFLGKMLLNTEPIIPASTTGSNTVFSGNMTFNGIQDIQDFMREMKDFLRRQGGKF